MPSGFLNNGSIRLRAVELSDVDTLFGWENDTAQWATTNTHAPYSRTQLWNYANNYDGDLYAQRSIRFIVCLCADGISIGTIDIYDFDPLNRHASIGVYISKQRRGKGYGVQALQLATRYAHHCIGMKQLIATVATDNAASQAMLTAAGYSCCGTLPAWLRRSDGSYCDAHIYHCTAVE